MTPSSPARPVKSPLAGVTSHLRQEGLVTVCATPAGISSYVIPDDDSRVTEVGMDQGRVTVKWVDDRFGTVWSVLDGGAVVEVACHDTAGQQEAYRQACAAVDAENRENALEAVRAVAGTLFAEAGVEVVGGPQDDAESQDETLDDRETP